MSNTWHSYFDKNRVESWSIYKFHKNWNRVHGGDHAENYCRSVDALTKSLRAIINGSQDARKTEKANKLLAEQQAGFINYTEVTTLLLSTSTTFSCNGSQDF